MHLVASSSDALDIQSWSSDLPYIPKALNRFASHVIMGQFGKKPNMNIKVVTYILWSSIFSS